MGFDAEGVEPSAWLCRQAAARGLTLHHGTLDQIALTNAYDVITLVDVIEHVDAPIDLLRRATHLLAEGGCILIVTPDVDSMAARLLGWKWWHFRVAHIGYFSRRSLHHACERTGLAETASWRPNWYFEVGYVWERLLTYLPRAWRPALPRVLAARQISVNLRDSLAVLAIPQPSRVK